MKAKWLIMGLSATLATGCGSLDGSRVKDGNASTTAPADRGQAAQGEANAPLTGSLIKQDIRRYGRITDGPSNVEVLDRAAIDRSGAADLKQALSLSGFR